MTYEFKVWRKNGLARIYVNGAYLNEANKAWFEKEANGKISALKMYCTTHNLRHDEGDIYADFEATVGFDCWQVARVDVQFEGAPLTEGGSLVEKAADFEAVATAVETFNAQPKAVEVDEREARIAAAQVIFKQAKKDERKEKKAKNNKIRELIIACKKDNSNLSLALKEARSKGLI